MQVSVLRKEIKLTLFSDHNGSLLRRQLGAVLVSLSKNGWDVASSCS